MLFKNKWDCNNINILQLIDFFEDKGDLSESDIVISEIQMRKNDLNRTEIGKKLKIVVQFLKCLLLIHVPKCMKVIKAIIYLTCNDMD